MSDALAITSDVQAAMARAADEVSRITHEEVVGAASRALAKIRADWPVDTGKSRDAFRDAEEPYGASVRCPVRYAGYVHKGEAERLAVLTTEAEVAVALERAAARVSR